MKFIKLGRDKELEWCNGNKKEFLIVTEMQCHCQECTEMYKNMSLKEIQLLIKKLK